MNILIIYFFCSCYILASNVCYFWGGGGCIERLAKAIREKKIVALVIHDVSCHF